MINAVDRLSGIYPHRVNSSMGTLPPCNSWISSLVMRESLIAISPSRD